MVVLAERLGELLSEVERRGVSLPEGIDESRPNGLDEPIVEAFRVGTMTLTWEAPARPGRRGARGDREEDPDAEDDEDLEASEDGPTCSACSCPPRRACIHRSCHRGGRSGPPTVPAVRHSAEPRGPHLPAQERLHALTWPTRARAATTSTRRGRGRSSRGIAGLESVRRPLDLLRERRLEIVGRLVEASNLNLYCRVTRRCPDPEPDLVAACVYKPIRGERPLDDFPDGTLAYREVAAYRVSEATGWNIVPPTVLRDGPLGTGMVQLWIDVDESVQVDRPDPRRRPGAAANGAVRRGDQQRGPQGRPHAAGRGGHVYGVDHGVCFSPDPKLRTILWGWRGRRVRAADEIEMLEELAAALATDARRGAARTARAEEVDATARRVRRLRSRGTFPQPDPDRPAIPWPPF